MAKANPYREKDGRFGKGPLRLSGDVLAPLSAPSSELRSITLAWAKQRWSYGSGGTPEVVRNSDPNFGKDVLIGWQGVKKSCMAPSWI